MLGRIVVCGTAAVERCGLRSTHTGTTVFLIYKGWPKKVSHYQTITKLY